MLQLAAGAMGDLMPTEPRRVLIVGPASYLGRRLVERLLDRPDIRVRVLARDPARISELAGRIPEVAVGDPLDSAVLRRTVIDAEIAYFPIGLVGADGDLARRLPVFAEQLRDACIEAGVRRTVYLGPPAGLAAVAGANQPVVDVGSILTARPERIQTVCLQAGFVLGPGSALFEVICHLVRKFPLMPVPRWMNSQFGWIGLADMLHDLVVASEVSISGDLVADIGPAPASVREMVVAADRMLGVKRLRLSLPVSVPRLSAGLLVLTTPLSYGLSRAFVSLLSSVTSESPSPRSADLWAAARRVPYTSLEPALAAAIHAEEPEQVRSRWTESLMGISLDERGDDLAMATFRDVRRLTFGDTPVSRVFRAVKSIGGRQGWFGFNVLWQIRGLFDKLAGGFGTSIGRRAE